MNERLDAAMTAGAQASGLVLEPFTDEERAEIEADAQRSAEVLCRDIPRPKQVNETVHRYLALELVDKHNAATVVERNVIQSLGSYKDMLAVKRSSHKQQTAKLQFVDQPWRVGTKFLVLYAGSPRFVAPIDDLDEWRYVSELFQGLAPVGRPAPLSACDVHISTRCVKTRRLRVIHYKSGQYLCLHRACDRCVDWLMYDEGPANRKRLAQLMAYEG